jgi:hypothetical protein
MIKTPFPVQLVTPDCSSFVSPDPTKERKQRPGTARELELTRMLDSRDTQRVRKITNTSSDTPSTTSNQYLGSTGLQFNPS